MMLDLRESLYDTYRSLILNGAAVYRQEIRSEGRCVPTASGRTGYVAVLKYTHLGRERPTDRLHQTLAGPRARRPPLGMENQLVEMLPVAAPGQRVYAPVAETVDGREPSRRIVLQTERLALPSGAHGPDEEMEGLTQMEARDVARDVALAGYPRTIGPRSEASRDRAVDMHGSAGG